jgi:hypothetical protein
MAIAPASYKRRDIGAEIEADMTKPYILILIRPSARLTEILRLRTHLLESGAFVSMVLLGLAAEADLPPGAAEIEIPFCQTPDPLLAERLGLPLMTQQELADRIAGADLVIPG